MLITIIMPCLNEAKALSKAIDEIPFDTLKDVGYEAELLVIDGGSRDGSVDIARGRGARVLVSERGYGRQYKLGFEHARGEIIVTADSDGSYPLSDIPRIVGLLDPGTFDFVSVNRFATMSPGAMNITRRTGNFILTQATNLLFGLHIKDSQSGMWVFRKGALTKLTLTSSGMSLSEEIIIEAFKKLKAVEFPGCYKPRIGKSKLKPLGHGWQNLSFLIKKWRKDRSSKRR
jgi:glycosyltransferase involved in cell wall biosynthesis